MLLLQLRHMVQVTTTAAVMSLLTCTMCHQKQYDIAFDGTTCYRKVTKASMDKYHCVLFLLRSLDDTLICARNNCFVTQFVPDHPTPRVTYVKVVAFPQLMPITMNVQMCNPFYYVACSAAGMTHMLMCCNRRLQTKRA
jgi:hypothetical protein